MTDVESPRAGLAGSGLSRRRRRARPRRFRRRPRPAAAGRRARPFRPAHRAGPAHPDRPRPQRPRRVQPELLDDSRQPARPGGRAAAAVRRPHGGGPGRWHRQRQVVAIQPAGRRRLLAGRGDPADHQGRARLRVGDGGRRAAAGLARRRAARTGTPGPARSSAARSALGGLVLLDLPDHDSVRGRRDRLEVNRLVGLADLMVWVLDPQKYADAAVHRRYLVPLAGHSSVIAVVLNQSDLLTAAAGARTAWPTCSGCSTPRACTTPGAGHLGRHRRRPRELRRC